ncbi:MULTISPECIES: hypothetical protein [Bacillus cereus group]|uniref:hypothetical protein n=1 Tax=Bacillus cereus group TaxID=86661 RepID=UPI0005393DC8|nr:MULTISPECIES: hypothetical protein [Bacillus cereus group]MDA2667129.1 hypothetical protein [Bacillus cereus group sp. Bc032]MDA2677836.1 hypothetical protein [Bacillus cereus group sp. Bc031]MDA2683343.1 hypothetical protein [Bacillus cereus group sp. Bc029]MDA2688775.1 hypothetical protein [Bacillus cereus group sp. Bc030]MDA2744313.1 hypothetical protein [Bacillus cereus group sp. Bc011]
MENKNNSFVVTVTPITDDWNSDTDNKLQIPEKKNFKNQQGSIKISSQSKEKLEALNKLTNTKYAHEIIDILIKSYVENELTSDQKRKFELLTDL